MRSRAVVAEGLIIARVGAITLLTINRAERSNAIDAATSAAIDEAIEAAEHDDSVGAVVITGAGNRVFCSGMDMKEAAEIGVGRGLISGRGFAGITERRRAKPLIAAVNGAAIAGGFEIALACDVVVAAEHAVFGLSEVKRGLFAYAGGIQRLARQVPRATALAMILTGETVPAARLFELGVISEVVPAERLGDRALELGQAILANSWEAVRNGKLLYEMAADSPLDHSLRFGAAFGNSTLASADSRAGVIAFADRHVTS